MSYFINNQQKLNDIVFADRNKAYGAYAIRSSYGNTVFRSLSVMLMGVGTIMSLAFYLSRSNDPDPEGNEQIIVHDSIYVIPFDLKKEEPQGAPEKKEQPAPKPSQDKAENSNVVVSDSALITKETTTTAIQTSSVPVTDDLARGPVTGSVGSGKGPGMDGADTTKKIKDIIFVDTQPEFEGGLAALYQFVSRNLKYPERALDEGRGGTVFVKFVVDETGKVGSLHLLNSLGYGMDDEAIRVVSMIPKFKTPAKIKGEPVKVYYQIPIRFRYKN